MGQWIALPADAVKIVTDPDEIPDPAEWVLVDPSGLRLIASARDAGDDTLMLDLSVAGGFGQQKVSA